MPQFVIAAPDPVRGFNIRNPVHPTAWMPDRVRHDKGTFVISITLKDESVAKTKGTTTLRLTASLKAGITQEMDGD